MTGRVQRVGMNIKRLQMRHHRALDAALAEHGITLVQWDALRHLQRNPEASLHDLAVLTHQSDQAFGTLAQRMIERGLIARVEGPGRAVRHRLTDRGEQLRHACDGVVDRVIKDSLSALDAPELAQLDALLAKALGSA
jgi:DNA-binding MarR family transcriptional regulator